MEKERYRRLYTYLKSYLNAEQTAKMYSEKYYQILEQGKAVRQLVLSGQPGGPPVKSDLSDYSVRKDMALERMLGAWTKAFMRADEICRYIDLLDDMEEKELATAVFVKGMELTELERKGRSYRKVKMIFHNTMEHLNKIIGEEI